MAVKCPKCQHENTNDAFYCSQCTARLRPEQEISATKTLETPATGLTSGTTFATRYEVIEELGKGGMGQVYKALDKEINEEVAIKLLKPEIASDDTTIERFRNELKFARKIAHKNICRMYHLEKEQETPYITMEYVEGEDLKSLIKKKGKFTQEEVLSVAKQVCEGLIEAHRLGVVHRDLKPQNIMIDEEGGAKIMDFGIARSVEAPGVTQTGVMIGTPDYISPEQAEGEEADNRSDIYALGVILYEMATGKVPFKGDTALEVALKHKSKLPSEPKELNPEISKDLNTLIMICMQKDRHVRYQNGKELLEDIKNIEQGIPLWERILPKKKREILWKRVFLYGGVSLLLVLIIAAAYFLFMGRGPAIDSIAVLPLENLTGSTEQEYFVNWITDELTTKLSRVGSLRVISFTSMLRYRGSDKSLQEIAQEMNVDAIVTGTVQQDGDNVSIRVQLIDVFPKEQTLWEESYERLLTDVLMMHSEIARTIAQEVRAKLSPEEETILAKGRQVNPDAQDAYSRGTYHMNQGTPEGYQEAVAYFNQAVEKDPSDPLAYAGLAAAYIQIAHSAMATVDSLPRAKAAAQTALRLDDTLAETLIVFGFIAGYYDYEWETAERAFLRAIEINPNLAMAHYWYSWQLVLFGRMEEAIAEHILAQSLDPLTPLHTAWLGALYSGAGQYEKALEEVNKALEISPDSWHGLKVLGMIYSEMGRHDEAIAVAQKASALYPELKSDLAGAYLAADRRDEALEVLAELEKLPITPIGALDLANLHAGLGNREEAFRWLNYEHPHAWKPWFILNPSWWQFSDDPRFKEAVREMNLPPMKKPTDDN